jgi:anaerobic selenocysteine-containing dehydrogenase
MNEPRYWTSLADYEREPSVAARREEEFAGRPEEYFEGIKRGRFDFGRREFLQWSSAALALASTACTRKPIQKIVPYAQQPEETLPGVASEYASTCRECAAGCGLIVKTMDQRPIKLEGNPQHPLNRGSLCVRGQASLLNLYDPDRLSTPRQNGRGRSQQPLAWPQADAALLDALRRVRPGRGVLLTGTIHGPARTQLLADFTSHFGMRHVTYDAFNPDALTTAQQECFGDAIVPRLFFERVDMLLTLGADPLGTGYSRQEWLRGFGRKRKLQASNGKVAMSRVVAVEPMLSLTGMNADTRHSVHPDDLLPFALALAHQLVIADRRSPFAGDATVRSALLTFEPGNTEAGCGLPQGTIAKLATELWAHTGRSLVLAGDHAASAGDEVHLQVVTSFLNTVLGNEGATIDGTASPSQQAQGSAAGMIELCREMRQGQVDLLLVYGTNPAYTLPAAVNFAAVTAPVGFVASIAERLDETARHADIVLPALHPMESWGDAEPQRGLLCLQQPTIEPLFEARAFEDTLLTLLRKSGATLPAAVPVAAVNAPAWTPPAASGSTETAAAGTKRH